MTVDEVRDHLKTHHLWVVERQTSRRGLPNIASFYILNGDILERIDSLIVFILGGDCRLISVGRVSAASIHDPYIHTMEEQIEDLSQRLYGVSNRISYTII